MKVAASVFAILFASVVSAQTPIKQQIVNGTFVDIYSTPNNERIVNATPSSPSPDKRWKAAPRPSQQISAQAAEEAWRRHLAVRAPEKSADEIAKEAVATFPFADNSVGQETDANGVTHFNTTVVSKSPIPEFPRREERKDRFEIWRGIAQGLRYFGESPGLDSGRHTGRR